MKIIHLFASLSLAMATAAGAQPTPADHPANDPAGTSVAVNSMSDGEVRKIDRTLGNVTLRHGPIANLEMPAMTMVFRVRDMKLLGSIKEGDKVKFAADRIDGALSLTAIEAAK